MKKQNFHYHVCKDHGRWKCTDPRCNLSTHAHCGFAFANDFRSCIKNKNLAPRLTFEQLAQSRVTEKITQKSFLNEACRLDLTNDQAKAQLREYRFKLRRAAKAKSRQKSRQNSGIARKVKK